MRYRLRRVEIADVEAWLRSLRVPERCIENHLQHLRLIEECKQEKPHAPAPKENGGRRSRKA